RLVLLEPGRDHRPRRAHRDLPARRRRPARRRGGQQLRLRRGLRPRPDRRGREPEAPARALHHRILTHCRRGARSTRVDRAPRVETGYYIYYIYFFVPPRLSRTPPRLSLRLPPEPDTPR